MSSRPQRSRYSASASWLTVQPVRHGTVRCPGRASRPPATTGVSHTDEIWFPLDPRRLLILGRPDDPLPEQYLRPPIETAATVNRTIAAGAYEHIYMHPDQDHLKGVQLPKAGPILQVSAELPFDLSRYTSRLPTPKPRDASNVTASRLLG
jgi:hypothetical protein